jgi:hypothetical protein
MDTLLAVFVETIKVMFQFIYMFFSTLVEQAAKGSVLACAVLIGILMPFAFAFLRLVIGQGNARSARRPRSRRR